MDNQVVVSTDSLFACGEDAYEGAVLWDNGLPFLFRGVDPEGQPGGRLQFGYLDGTTEPTDGIQTDLAVKKLKNFLTT